LKTIKRSLLWVSCAWLVLGISSLGAAEKAATGAAQPQPNPALKQLQLFAGSWHCTGTDFGGPGGPRDRATAAKVTASWELGNYWLNLRYEVQADASNPTPLVTDEHWGYSELSKKLMMTGVESLGGYFTEFSDGGWTEDKLVFSGDTVRMGKKVASRETFTHKGDNELHHIGEQKSGGGAWHKVDEEACTRTSSTP
jgi:hypothetical protein